MPLNIRLHSSNSKEPESCSTKAAKLNRAKTPIGMFSLSSLASNFKLYSGVPRQA